MYKLFHLHTGGFVQKDSDQLNTADKKFTSKEIDIISLLMSGRSAKSIALLLDVAPKTVEAHLHNVKQKIGCGGKEGIIQFFEQSRFRPMLMTRYEYLVLRGAIKELLNKFHAKFQHLNQQAFTIYVTDTHALLKENSQYLLENLSLIGYQVTIKSVDIKVLDPLSLKNDCLILGTQEICKSMKLISKNLSSDEIAEDALFALVILPTEQDTHATSQFEYVVEPLRDIQFLFLKILQERADDSLVDSACESLLEKKQPFFAFGSFTSDKPQKSNHLANKLAAIKSFLTIRLPFKSLSPIIISFGILGLVGIGVHFPYALKQGDKIVKAAISLPSEHFLLERKHLLKKIDIVLHKDNKKIGQAILVGPPGSGKTTLARQYAKKQTLPIIWEINSETLETLMQTLEELSEALAETPDEKNELLAIAQTEGHKAKKNKLLTFLKRKLCEKNDWILIYDNVESLENIKDFIPFDKTVWGQGSVIITTTDLNVENDSLFSPYNTIKVGELSQEEVKQLFQNIIMQGAPHNLEQIDEATKKLLVEISPLPLDIITAGHYIKATNTQVDDYIKLLQSSDFVTHEKREDFLRIYIHYHDTRHNLVYMSLDKLLRNNPAFKELLFLLTLMNVSNIPVELLYAYFTPVLVNDFILNLQKLSLAELKSEQVNKDKLSVLQLHKQIQRYMRTYTEKVIPENERLKMLNHFLPCVERYVVQTRQKGDLAKLKLMIPHLLSMLEQETILDNISIGSLQYNLAYIYRMLSEYTKAKQLLEDALIIFQNKDQPQWVAKISVEIGSINMHQGNFQKAKIQTKQAYDLYKKYNDESSIQGKITALMRLGIIHRQMGDFDQSSKYLRAVLDFLQKQKNVKHLAARATLHYATLCLMQNDIQQAHQYTQEALTYFTQVNSDYDIQWANFIIGRCYLAEKQFEKGKKCLEKTYEFYKKTFGRENVRTQWVATHYGYALCQCGQFQKGLSLLEEAYLCFADKVNSDHYYYYKLAITSLFLEKVYKMEGVKEKEAHYHMILQNTLKKLPDSLKKSTQYFNQ